MTCPACGVEMVVVMEEALATWYRCAECKRETIRPPEWGHIQRYKFSL